MGSLALGAFLATSGSGDADVECFASATSTEPLSSAACKPLTPSLMAILPTNVHSLYGSVSRSIPSPRSILSFQRHSQYVAYLTKTIDRSLTVNRVVGGFLLLLLGLALRQHFMGETIVWSCPVTTYPWFNKYSKYSPRLPPPVTSRARSRGKTYGEKDFRDVDRRPSRQSPRYEERGRTGWKSQRAPAKAHTTDRYDRHHFQTHIHDKFARGASPRR
jgi:hypothetical protein